MKTEFTIPVLRTKLYKPHVKDHYVVREHVIDFLEQHRQNPLTLVVAATGYGKSVTVSQWLDRTSSKYCWLSLDSEFNDVRIFFLYLLCGIQSVIPGALEDMADLLTGTETPPLKILVNRLINGLDAIDQELIIVLDDFHEVHNSQIHEVVAAILNNPPPNIHLVLISRRDVEINMSASHSFGDISELRMSDLRFGEAEISELAVKVLKYPLDDRQTRLLQQKTEGWIVGLRLALVQLKGSTDRDETLLHLSSEREYFSGYLLQEVLSKQTEQVQKLFLTISIADQFNLGLAKCLLSDDDEFFNNIEQQSFDDLLKTDSFVNPLDAKAQWYRFHHLFRDFLTRRLENTHSEEYILDLHRKASLYFESINLHEQAITHAVRTGSKERIEEIFYRHKHELLSSDEFARLDRWIGLIPKDIVETSPPILLTRAILEESRADYPTMQQDLIIVESLVSSMTTETETNRILLGEFYALKSALAYYTGETKNSLTYSTQALKSLPDEPMYIRDFALAFHSFGLQESGDEKKAIALLKKKTRMLEPAQTQGRTRLMLLHTLVLAYKGALSELLESAVQLKPLCKTNKLYVSFAYANYYIGVSYYFRNDLGLVESHLDETDDYKYAGRPFWVLNCWVLKGFALDAQGKTAALKEHLDMMKSYTESYDHDNLKHLINAFQTELALRHNNVDEAREIANKTNFEIYPPVFYYYFPQLTYIRYLISLDHAESLQEAESRLQTLIHFGQTTRKNNLLISALPLLAMLHRKQQKYTQAVQTLEESIHLSENGGYLRNYLDLGESVQVLIQELYRKDPDNQYLSEILQAFKKEQSPHSDSSLMIRMTPAPGGSDLTKREIDILTQIASGHQNKEIAEHLYVSIDTVKKHLYNLYQKLGVNNRTAAIAKANLLGLIVPKEKHS